MIQHVRHEGEGPPLVLLHGAGASAAVWTPLLDHLRAFDVIAPSFPGRGGSDGPALERADAIADRLLGWLDHLGGPPPIVLGHSLGGAVAMELARAAPSRVRGLVLVATSARLKVHPAILSLWEAAVAGGARPSSQPAVVDASALTDAYLEAETATPAEAALADWRACDAFDRRDALGVIDVPALVISGSEDALTPPRRQASLVEGLPRAMLETVEGAGHLLAWERPAALARIVRAWAAGIG